MLNAVRATVSNLSSEWVHRMVRRRLPWVSLGTVYRNLRLLVAEWFVEELAGPREKGAVHVDLLLHLGVVDDALGAAHLLDLEQQGLPVLEDEREVGPTATWRFCLSAMTRRGARSRHPSF